MQKINRCLKAFNGLNFLLLTFAAILLFATPYVRAESEQNWPWGNESQFPWSHIDGFWRVDGADKVLVLKTLSGRQPKALRISILNSSDCSVLGRGIGFATDETVRALISVRKQAQDFSIHAFDENLVLMITSENPYFSETHQLIKAGSNIDAVCPN